MPPTSSIPSDQQSRTNSVFLHLASFLKFIIPLAGVIVPLIIWSAHRDKEFVDANGRQAINFQLSLILYKFLLLIACIPVFVIMIGDLVALSEAMEKYDSILSLFSVSVALTWFVILLIILSLISVFEIIVVILAAVKASGGLVYRYPLSIGFIRKESQATV
ncbi:MAG TPA: DUF4870 domain-containing protein [Flavobacteriaceae bacterium]|nr:DUF4870 domain-containing protein [Flavobacteriaceae bacterium]